MHLGEVAACVEIASSSAFVLVELSVSNVGLELLLVSRIGLPLA